jgi:hypothetical protein
MHVGDDIIYLRSTKLTTPSLNIDINQDGVADFFANMTKTRTTMNKDSIHYFPVDWDNNNYYVCDDTTYVGGPVDLSTLDASEPGHICMMAFEDEDCVGDAKFSYGSMSTRWLCSSTSGTYAVAGTPDESSGGKNCWCKVDGYAAPGESSLQNISSSRWVFLRNMAGPTCSYNCMLSCGDELAGHSSDTGMVWDSSDFRRALYGQ